MMHKWLYDLRSQIRSIYEDEGEFVVQRAIFLYTTCLSALGIAAAVLLFNLWLYPMGSWMTMGSVPFVHVVSDMLLILLFALVLWLVKRGDLDFAMRFAAVSAASVVIISAALNMETFLDTGLNSMIHLFYVTTLLIVFFSSRHLRFVLGGAMLIANVVFYAIVIIADRAIFVREVMHTLMTSTAVLGVMILSSHAFIEMLNQMIADKEAVINNNQELNSLLENKVMLRTQELMEYTHQLEKEIRKRNNMEVALKESELRYRTIFESSGTGICIVDTNGLITLCNMEFCRLTGYQKIEIESKISWTRFVHHDDFKRIYNFMTTIQTSSVYDTHTDFRMVDRYNRLYELSMNVEKVSDDNHLIVSLLDVTEKNNALTQLRHAASTDALTSLYNRRYLMDTVDDTLRKANEISQNVAVIYMDIDNFKHINDTYGHALGDDLLQGVGLRLKRLVEPDGIASRIGGDEFAMLMPVQETQTAINRVQRFIEDMRAPFEFEQLTIHMSFSIGISFYPKDGHDGAELIHMADLAMYHAKKHGKNQYALHSGGLSAPEIKG